MSADVPSIAESVQAASREIREELLVGRQARISFSAKRADPKLGPRLEPRYVLPDNATYNAHNYPLSVAGWALAEGRIVRWPEDRERPCDFERIAQLKKLDALDQLVGDDELINSPPYLARMADPADIQVRFRRRDLVIGAFYQDWAGWSPAPRYTQFVCVPVPLIMELDTPSLECGVFNIDSFELEPLLVGCDKQLDTIAGRVEEAFYRANRHR
jgi:hypothetical protein